MSRWPYAFFGAAVLYVLIGAPWGMYMGATENFTAGPAHAHLNLLGWVSLAIMGAFYAQAGARTPAWLMAANFILSNLGVVATIFGLFCLLTGFGPGARILPLLVAGEVAVVLGFAAFGWAVLRAAGRAGAEESSFPRS